MNEIITFPKSLQGQIQQAQNLLARSADAEQRGDIPAAVNHAHQGMHALVEIAQRNPEIAAVLLALMHGYHGVVLENLREEDYYEQVEKRFMGFVVGTQMVPMKRRVLDRRSIHFF